MLKLFNFYIKLYIYGWLNNQYFNQFFFFYKVFVLGITIQLDISAKLTLQVTTIICHHMKYDITLKSLFNFNLIL